MWNAQSNPTLDNKEEEAELHRCIKKIESSQKYQALEWFRRYLMYRGRRQQDKFKEKRRAELASGKLDEYQKTVQDTMIHHLESID